MGLPYNLVPQLSEYWFGTLLTDKRDGSGLLYRRNRYYDPSSARFTQEDPIGLAGGLNAYGFAAGDPVTYSDPFGLKVDSIPKVWREKLGDMCTQVDCTRANIVTTGFIANRIPAGRAMTLGNNMFFGRAPDPNNPADVALVAHELTHVGDFQNQPALLSVAEVVATRWYDLTGVDPYRWQQYPLGSFYEYNMESRGQIVQDCFSGRSEVACHISIYKPNNWDPSQLYGP